MTQEEPKTSIEIFQALSPDDQTKVYEGWVKARFPDAESESDKYFRFAQQEFGNPAYSMPNESPVKGVTTETYFKHWFNVALEGGLDISTYLS